MAPKPDVSDRSGHVAGGPDSNRLDAIYILRTGAMISRAVMTEELSRYTTNTPPAPNTYVQLLQYLKLVRYATSRQWVFLDLQPIFLSGNGPLFVLSRL